MPRTALILFLTAALALLATTATAEAGTLSCGYNGYSYAGVTALQTESGIRAGITAVASPSVTTGHVAAWVGVGGAGLGPGGSNEWLQAGISSIPGQPTSLYTETARPGQAPRYRVVPLAVRLGHTYRIAVQESPTRPGSWSVWVDGVQRTGQVLLPGSHDAWKPVATSESWDGGSPACNAFTFRFSEVQSRIAASDAWSPMSSQVIDAPGYHVEARTLAGFLAVGGRA
jgi:hypothetical protein